MSDSDSDSTMRSMMGFSRFGTQRPTSKKASDAPLSTGSNAAPVSKKAKTRAASTTITQIMQQSGISPSPPFNQTDPDISTVPKKSNTATSTPSAPGATTTSTTAFQSTTAAPPGLPTTQPLPRLSDSGRTSTNTSSSFVRASDSGRTDANTTTSVAYTSPTNPAYKLTSAELNALRNGRRNTRGDTVFFKPGFIDENPWKTLQDIARQGRGRGNDS